MELPLVNQLDNVRISRVSTIAFFVFTQLRAQLEALADAKANVYIVTSHDELEDNIHSIKNCIYKPITIERDINLKKDFIALIRLWKFFRKERMNIVHSTTPKAGLLCAIAAKLARTPVCAHTFTGQAWVTMTGMRKRLTRWSDKLIGVLNTQCYADSVSQKEFLVNNKIIRAEKIKVIGSGSLAGVSVERFSPTRFSTQDKDELKMSLGIEAQTYILLFVGRITKEKGIFELFEAMSQLIQNEQDIVLIVVGPFEQDNEEEIRSSAQRWCGNRVRFTGFEAEPERYMAISDVLCLPSYREGFGTVVIEAAAMGIPTVGTNIYGLSDAVVDEVTGILVEPKNSNQLAQVLNKILSNDLLRLRMGEQARERAVNEFDSAYCSALLVDEYKRLLHG